MPSTYQAHSVAALLVATVLGGLGCLPRGPISIPWDSILPPCEECQHGAEAGPHGQGCDAPCGDAHSGTSQNCGSRMPFGWQIHGPANNNAADGYVSPPHSMFHPVPTRPVFTPWIVEQPQPSLISVPDVELPPGHSTAVGKPAPQVAAEPAETGTPARPVARRGPPTPINLDPDDKAKAPAGGSSSAGGAKASSNAASVGGTAGGWRGTDLD